MDNHVSNFGFIVFEILCCIDNQDFFWVVSLEPIFMLDMDLFQILKWDFILLRSLSDLCSFMTSFWSASEVNNLCFLLRCHWLKTWIKGLENLVLTFIHVTTVLHQFRKDIFISQDASLWDFEFIWVSFHSLLKLFYSCEDGINLECKSPSLRLSIVFLKHVNLLST